MNHETSTSSERQAATRRRRRRRLLWIAAPALIALIAAAKLGSVVPLGAAAQQGFAEGDANAVATASAWLGLADVVEPYKTHFARGDAAALAGDFSSARDAFAAALPGSSAADECKVRVNLALSIERLGDDAGSTDAARERFTEALAVVQEAPPGCFAEDSPGNRDGEGEQLSSAADRLQGKLADAGSSSESDSSEDDSEEEPQDAQSEELESRAEEAQRNRWASEDSEEFLESDVEQMVDEPW